MRSAIDGGVVLVTGASSGIGMAIARLVASRAATLILVARRVDRLARLKEELLGVRRALRVEIIAADLGERASTDYLAAEVAKRGLEVDVLVNNAGVGLMGMFDLAEPAKLAQMIDLNVTSLVLLTRAFLPGMVERKRGGVLNVSSSFGLGVTPAFAAYLATKHFVTGFTEGLLADLAGTGVVVSQVCPGPVATEFEGQIGNFTGQKAPAIVEISAERCAKAAVSGFDHRRAMVIPGFMMKLVMLINGTSPRFMRRLFAHLLGGPARKRQLGAMVKTGATPDVNA